MRMFGGLDDEEEIDGPIGIGSSWKEDVLTKADKRRIAEEIASGLTSALSERDEEIWEMVREIQEGK